MKYNNPIISGFYPDPSVCRVNEDYYLVTSTFEYFPGVPIFHSKDLINWKQIGHCLTRQSQIQLNNTRCSNGIFAPTIRYNNGVFYMITTNVGSGGNFYVYTDNPSGDWSEPIWVDDELFDPSLFFDDDGKVYYTRRGITGIVQAEIDITTGKLKSELREISKGMCSPDIEGPHLYKINGLYYLMAAEGGTRRGHCETIARSESPWGPFQSCPYNPILTQRQYTEQPIRDTGHAELLQAHDGSWWIFFLGTRNCEYESYTILGRETFLAPVTWTDDGWPMVNLQMPILERMTCKGLPQYPAEKVTGRDEFEKGKLEVYWNFIRNPQVERYSLTERQGFLRLKGTAYTLDDEASVTFVGRRQRQFKCSVKAEIDFSPNAENEEAGLTVFMNNRHHYEIAIMRIQGKKAIIVRRRIGDLKVIVKWEFIKPGNVILFINSTSTQYEFLYSVNGDEIKKLATALSKYICTEMDSGFTGMYFGMYATGNGTECKSNADFKWFEYEDFNKMIIKT